MIGLFRVTDLLAWRAAGLMGLRAEPVEPEGDKGRPPASRRARRPARKGGGDQDAAARAGRPTARGMALVVVGSKRCIAGRVDVELVGAADPGGEVAVHAGGDLAATAEARDQDHLGTERLDRDDAAVDRATPAGGRSRRSSGRTPRMTGGRGMRREARGRLGGAAGSRRRRQLRQDAAGSSRASSRFIGGLARKPATKVSAGLR